MEIFLEPATYISLATLTLLEVVLGIDNIIFISILTNKLPEHQREKGRITGLILALVFRIILLLSIVWIAGLVHPWFTVAGFDVTGRDVILIGGGLFLLSKSTLEIHSNLEGREGEKNVKGKATLTGIIIQIILLDMVFSFDSVITAVGLVKHVEIMIVAIIISIIVMIIFAKSVSGFIEKHPTIKMLALAFLLMIGLLLFVEGLHVEVPKGYVYFAMAFSIFVELLNMKIRKRKEEPVHLKKKYTGTKDKK
jgi:predicted tellurium resistance membrane protein TerC